VASTNECVANPCQAHATCNDPNDNVTGDYTCTCDAGYGGNGMQRNQLVCTACGAGQKAIAGLCVCDLSGTFELKITMGISWSGIVGLADATNVASYTWAIQHQTYDDNGQLVITTTPCGGVTPDLCGNVQGINSTEAYAQYFPNDIWEQPSMPTQQVTMQLPNALPGQNFTSSNSAVLLGVRLDSPLGAWPTSNAQIGTSENNKVCYPTTNPTNCAYRKDDDADTTGHPGVTSLVVKPGGVSTNVPQTYGTNSPRCGDAYAYYPRQASFTPTRASAFYMATRTISRFNGKITSCDRIEGAPNTTSPHDYTKDGLRGPKGTNNQVQLDARWYGCQHSETTGNPPMQADCNTTETNFFDTQTQTQTVTSAGFVMKRTSNSAITCAEVRADTF
jgi:hypothetical protein